MSRNILDELYDYDLFHLTEIEDMDGSYKTALDRLVKAEAELKKAYPDRTDILDEYQSADIELHNLSNRNEFRKGFKVCAQLVLEMIKPINWGGRYEQIQERTDRIQLPEKEIRSAVETGYQHYDRFTLQYRYTDRGEQDVPYRLHQVSSSFLWQPLPRQASQARQWGEDRAVSWWYGTESQWSYLPSGGALEADWQLLSESCPQRWRREDARSGELLCLHGERSGVWVYGLYLKIINISHYL